MNDVIAQKIASLQRCVWRAKDAHRRAGAGFATTLDLQDVAVLNIIRACDTAIDLANICLRRLKLGIPTESRESFAMLLREGLLDPGLGIRLQKMVGFRNLAVHQYRELDLNIVEAVILERLDDLLAYAESVRRLLLRDST